MSGGGSFDVVVIGAGISGLTAAALLARRDLSVCILEEQPRAGGYLQGFSRGGFHFDPAVQWLNGMGPRGMAGRLLEHIGADRPECPELEAFQRYRGESFDYLLDSDPDRMRDAMVADFPAERDGINRLFDDARELGRRMELLHNRARAMESMSPWTKMVRGLGMLGWYLGVRRHLRPGLEEGLARYVADPAFARIYIAEEKLASAMMPVAWAYAGDLYGAPRGGSVALVNWLIDHARACGAELHLGEPVEQLLLDGQRVTGARCASGLSVAARHVIYAADVWRLYTELLPPEASSDKLRAKLQAADLSYSNLTLFLGLDCDPATLGLGTEQVLLTRDDVPRAEQMASGPDRAALTVCAPSLRDDSLAPAGKGTVVIHCPAWLEDHERWGAGEGLARGRAYRQVKQEQAQVVLDRVEQGLCPGLAAHVELMEIATPLTYQRYTRNRGGAVIAARATDANIKARLAHYETPVKGLLLAGHWAEYSGGVPMAIKAAANTSLLLLREAKREAFGELCELMDA